METGPDKGAIPWGAAVSLQASCGRGHRPAADLVGVAVRRRAAQPAGGAQISGGTALSWPGRLGAGHFQFCAGVGSAPAPPVVRCDHQLPSWDLVVVDEAHRTAGRLGKAWAAVHHDDHLEPFWRRPSVVLTRGKLRGRHRASRPSVVREGRAVRTSRLLWPPGLSRTTRRLPGGRRSTNSTSA